MPTESHNAETIVLHAGAIAPTRPPMRWRCRSIRRRRYQFNSDRACRQSVRAEGARQHLHPHHESDAGGAGRARRRARRRGRGAGAGLGPGGLAVCGPEHLPGRRQFRLLDRPLRRHLEPVPEHDEARWASSAASSIRPIPRISAAPPTRRRAATTPRRCPTRSSPSSRSPRSPRSAASSACR